MERLTNFFKGPPPPTVEKRFIREQKVIRDKRGRPYYLASLSLIQKYPKAFVFGGAGLSALVFYSGLFYKALFTNPADQSPYDYMWRSELDSGLTKLESLRLEKKRNQEKKEMYEARIALAQKQS